jgi:deoxyadenosine/deoxycytidine kinase
VDTAIERIRKRNRGLEAGIPRDYLERLNNRYLAFYDAYDASPKIKVDTEATPLHVEANVPAVLQRVREALGVT